MSAGEIEAEAIMGELTIRLIGKAQTDLIAGGGERDLLSKLALELQHLVGPRGQGCSTAGRSAMLNAN